MQFFIKYTILVKENRIFSITFLLFLYSNDLEHFWWYSIIEEKKQGNKHIQTLVKVSLMILKLFSCSYNIVSLINNNNKKKQLFYVK